jgi:hypothetical protein
VRLAAGFTTAGWLIRRQSDAQLAPRHGADWWPGVVSGWRILLTSSAFAWRVLGLRCGDKRHPGRRARLRGGQGVGQASRRAQGFGQTQNSEAQMNVSGREIVVAGTESGRPCVDLAATFGARYGTKYDESYYAERPEFRADEAALLTIIPCRRRGDHIYPFGGRMLAAFTTGREIRARLLALDCVRVHQDGRDGGHPETTVLFDAADFTRVAAVIEPKRRRRLSPEQRAACADRLKAYQFQPTGHARNERHGDLETHGAA